MLTITYKYQRETLPLTVGSLDTVFSNFETAINNLSLLYIQDWTFGRFHVGSILLGEYYNWEAFSSDSKIWAPINQSAGITSENNDSGLFNIANNFTDSTDNTIVSTGSASNGWCLLITGAGDTTQITGDAIDLNLTSDHSVTGILVRSDVYYVNNGGDANTLFTAIQIRHSDNTWHTIPRSIRRKTLWESSLTYYVCGSIEMAILINANDILTSDKIIKGVRIVAAKYGGTTTGDFVTIEGAYLTVIPLVGAF